MRQPMHEDQLRSLTLQEMNHGLRSYRPDLRYTREDAVAYAKLWNACKVSTVATIATVDGLPVVIVVDSPAH